MNQTELKSTPGTATEVTPGKFISEYAMQSASAFMPHIAQNQYRDDNVRTLASMFEHAVNYGRKGYIKYRSMEAAAPDMYEALQEARENLLDAGYFNHSLIIKQIDAALNKAQGK